LRTISVLVFGLLLSTPIFSNPQKSLDAQIEMFSKHYRKVSDLHKDLIQQAKSGTPDNLEYEVSSELMRVAENMQNYLDSGTSFILVYKALSCPEDREAAKPIIKAQFESYLKYMESDIENINFNLANTHRPGTAATGSSLKDEVREVRDFFKSVIDGL
jgi:hypothetical protein